MASIHGLELKNVKSFMGHEGKCYQGNLYLNKKKIGFWSQDGWGRQDEFWFIPELHINKEKFEQVVEETFPVIKYCGREFAVDLETLMIAILSLKEREKDFKKNQTEDFPILVITEMEDWREYWNHYTSEMNDTDIEKRERDYINTREKKAEINRVFIYRKPEDFIIGESFKLEDLVA